MGKNITTEKMESCKLPKLKMSQTAKELNNLCNDADPVFTRKHPLTKLRPVPKFDNTFSTFRSRLRPQYIPGKKNYNTNSWNVQKNDVLEYIRMHRQSVECSPELLKKVQSLKSVGGLSVKFPKCTLRMSTHQKVVESNS